MENAMQAISLALFQEAADVLPLRLEEWLSSAEIHLANACGAKLVNGRRGVRENEGRIQALIGVPAKFAAVIAALP